MAFRSSTSNGGNSATPSVTVPASVAANDIVILALTVDNTALVISGKWPSGFVHLDETDVTQDGQSMGIAYKRLTGADAGSYTMASIGAAADYVMQAIAFSGRDTTNPPVNSTVATATGVSASPANVNASTVTALLGDDLVWTAAGDGPTGTATSFTPPATYTEAQDQLGGSFASQSIAYKENVSAGATGTVTGQFVFSGGTQGWASWLIRIPLAGASASSATAPTFNPIPFMGR